MAPNHFERLQVFLQHLPDIDTAAELATATGTVSAAFGLSTVMVGALLIRGDKVGGRLGDHGAFLHRAGQAQTWRSLALAGGQRTGRCVNCCCATTCSGR